MVGVGVGREVGRGTSPQQPIKPSGERVDEWTPALGQLTTCVRAMGAPILGQSEWVVCGGGGGVRGQWG
jgi:hypothetical protein